MYIRIKIGNTKNKLILKLAFTSLKTIDKFIDLLKFNNVAVKELRRDDYLIYL